MNPIIRAGLSDRKASAIGWSFGIAVYVALNVLVYDTIKDQAKALNETLQSLPPAAQALFGSAGDFLSPVGYLNSKLYYLILPLLFTMLAINLSSQLLAREEQNGTIELLLARPLSRLKLFLAKLSTAFIVVLAVGLINLLVTIACLVAIDYEISLWRVTAATGVTLLLSLLFSSVAWLLIGLGKAGRRGSTGIASAIALGSYLLTSLEGFASWLEFPAKLLPYHYFQPDKILMGTYNWWNALGMLLASAIILSLAALAFNRRDLS